MTIQTICDNCGVPFTTHIAGGSGDKGIEIGLSEYGNSGFKAKYHIHLCGDCITDKDTKIGKTVEKKVIEFYKKFVETD